MSLYISSEAFWLLLALPIYLIFFFILLIRKNNFFNIFFYSLVYIYIIWVLSVCFFPMDFQENSMWRNIVQLYPFKTILEMKDFFNLWLYNVALKQLWWNILLLMPAWFFLQILLKKYKTFFQAFYIWFFISLIIESTQLFLSVFVIDWRYKIFDVDDLLLNTVWFILWFLIYKCYAKIINYSQSKK